MRAKYTVRCMFATMVFCLGSQMLLAQDKIIGNDTSSIQEHNVVQVLEHSGKHTVFVSLLKEARADELLKEEGPFTILAPTDAAFASVNVDSLWQNKERLRDLVYAHLLQGQIPAANIERSMNIIIHEGDIEATNGRVHYLGQVLKATGK